MIRRNCQRGFTLVELMLGMTVSLVVLASALALFSVSASVGGDHLKKSYLRSQLNLMTTTISDEITRAGYCFDCDSSNIFIRTDGLGERSAILIDDSATLTSGDCILFAYNHDNRNKPVAPLDKDDAKGFRLGTDPNNKSVIEVYENWNDIANWSCDSSHWRDMTYDRLVITTLAFERQSLAVIGSGNKSQSVQVTIGAELRTDTSIKDEVSVTVNIPNVDG
ncbi:PilW family protein [Enterovibrio nigricans]|uniref:Prepilin-type N-terminal cleavage/methylation domain-containing protein n=1 Tax=Enterovibrio nigricans DSM 22720 TaxID=1121868 RepID=A0A1T4V0D3_9GAMM|nr:prepilin-type N-terminal cleavage/methylation domain-containing protein [Enterovibrio nigricans]PKF50597.1 pilus assembly protein PilW [Enterovibrio nigricans]SKA58402.1 prepilin-type N-terminal cleavage/methylation domain-containing protein [Enterovibrio nigricans DSM 22720]